MNGPSLPAKRNRSECAASDVCSALSESFGVEQCFSLGLCDKEQFEQKYMKCFLKTGFLKWSRIFGRKDLPTKLEVCSGSGDWVIAQAKEEAGVANWIASELRYDRVHSIFTKMVLQRVENLGVLAGDAGSIFRAHIPPESLSVICVNFPEPSQTTRNASCQEAESELHLLTPEFFRNAHATLQESGVLTIFSDNLEYTRSLASCLGDLHTDGARIFDPHTDVDDELADQENGVLIWQGTPGAEAGHAVAESSQFDRFFQHGNHSERYYISVVKV